MRVHRITKAAIVSEDALNDLSMLVLKAIDKLFPAQLLSIIHSSLFLLSLYSSFLVCSTVLLIWQLNVLMIGSTITISTSDTIRSIIELLNLVINRQVACLRVVQLLL